MSTGLRISALHNTVPMLPFEALALRDSANLRFFTKWNDSLNDAKSSNVSVKMKPLSEVFLCVSLLPQICNCKDEVKDV